MSPGVRGQPRFIADAMLGSLARKLRALGFDTSYYKGGEDAGLLREAQIGGRVILTSDRTLAARAAARRLDVVLLKAEDDGGRLSTIARTYRSKGAPMIPGDPLCSVCGGGLETLGKLDVSGTIPPSIVRRHRLFFKCRECGKLYWRGSHWKKLRSLARRLG